VRSTCISIADYLSEWGPYIWQSSFKATCHSPCELEAWYKVRKQKYSKWIYFYFMTAITICSVVMSVALGTCLICVSVLCTVSQLQTAAYFLHDGYGVNVDTCRTSRKARWPSASEVPVIAVHRMCLFLTAEQYETCEVRKYAVCNRASIRVLALSVCPLLLAVACEKFIISRLLLLQPSAHCELIVWHVASKDLSVFLSATRALLSVV
jgi:hypothetical protein